MKRVLITAEEKARKKENCSLTSDFVQIGLCLACIIICVLTFSWFTMTTDLSASGMSLASYTLPTIKVAKVSGGVDISELAEADNKLIIAPTVGTPIFPGSSGSFTAYLSSNFTADYIIRSSIVPYAPPPDGVAYRTDDPTKQQRGITYLQTHIACFLSYDPINNIYSDWIPNGTGLTVNISSTEQAVTFYWVWFETYTEIANLTSPADLALIEDYIDENPELYFDRRINTDSTYATEPERYLFYNYADEDIGTSIENIRFEMTFLPR